MRRRGLRREVSEGPEPQFGLYLLDTPPPPMGWPSRGLHWPDWRLPVYRADARDALGELWPRAGQERVEVACNGAPSLGEGRAGSGHQGFSSQASWSCSGAREYLCGSNKTETYSCQEPWSRGYSSCTPGAVSVPPVLVTRPMTMSNQYLVVAAARIVSLLMGVGIERGGDAPKVAPGPQPDLAKGPLDPPRANAW